MLLSILIPTIESRKSKFDALMSELSYQKYTLIKNHPTLPQIEIIADKSKPFLEGGLSIGAKRQKLLEESAGKYICFLDDDDNCAPNYIETLIRLLEPNPDVVTFRSICKLDNFWCVLNMSLNNKYNQEVNPSKGTIQRTVWHVNAIRSSIAKQFSFDASLNHNEDWTWMKQVIPHLLVEVHTDAILTQYNHNSKYSEADKIVRANLNFENREPNY